MVIDGYRLVRPGAEASVVDAVRGRRRIEIRGGVVAALAALATAALAVFWMLPAAARPGEPWIAEAARVGAALGAALLIGGLVWRLTSAAAERRYLRARDALTRDASPILDVWGAVPDAPAEHLWEALARHRAEDPSAIASLPSPWTS